MAIVGALFLAAVNRDFGAVHVEHHLPGRIGKSSLQRRCVVTFDTLRYSKPESDRRFAVTRWWSRGIRAAGPLCGSWHLRKAGSFSEGHCAKADQRIILRAICWQIRAESGWASASFLRRKRPKRTGGSNPLCSTTAPPTRQCELPVSSGWDWRKPQVQLLSSVGSILPAGARRLYADATLISPVAVPGTEPDRCRKEVPVPQPQSFPPSCA